MGCTKRETEYGQKFEHFCCSAVLDFFLSSRSLGRMMDCLEKQSKLVTKGFVFVRN